MAKHPLSVWQSSVGTRLWVAGAVTLSTVANRVAHYNKAAKRTSTLTVDLGCIPDCR